MHKQAFVLTIEQKSREQHQTEMLRDRNILYVCRERKREKIASKILIFARFNLY